MKLSQIESILRRSERLDAGETGLSSRDLLAVINKTYDVKYPGLKAREFIPMNSSTNPGAEAIAYHQFDQYGAAKIISKNAKDVPRVDVSKAEFTSPVKTLAAAYGYEWHELKRAAQSGLGLTEMRARAARRALEQGIDDIMSDGDEPSGLEGFIDHSAVNEANDSNGAWSGNTALEIFTSLSGVVNLIESQTKGVHRCTDVIMPIAQYQLISTKPWGTDTNMSVRKFFQEQFPDVALHSWHKLTGKGASATDRLIAYARDPEVVEGMLPLDFEQLPPEAQGLEVVINCLARVGGVQVRYPKAIEYLDAI